MQAVELNTFMMENVASKFHFREPTPNLPLVLLRIEISNCMGNNMLLYNPSNARKIPRYKLSTLVALSIVILGFLPCKYKINTK